MATFLILGHILLWSFGDINLFIYLDIYMCAWYLFRTEPHEHLWNKFHRYLWIWASPFSFFLLFEDLVKEVTIEMSLKL